MIGLLGAFALVRVLTNLLFEVKPLDPITFAGGVAAAFHRCGDCLLAARAPGGEGRSDGGIEMGMKWVQVGTENWSHVMTAVWQDIRYAIRTLLRSPGFAVMVIGILAVGMGGSLMIFSIFNELNLRPFPVPEQERLVDLDERAAEWNLEYTGMAYQDFHESAPAESNVRLHDRVDAYRLESGRR